MLNPLTLMLLTAKLAKTKLCKNPEKPLKPLANGYSSESAQQELSNEYQHDRVLMVLKNLCILVLWAKVATALEGLIKRNRHHKLNANVVRYKQNKQILMVYVFVLFC